MEKQFKPALRVGNSRDFSELRDVEACEWRHNAVVRCRDSRGTCCDVRRYPPSCPRVHSSDGSATTKSKMKMYRIVHNLVAIPSTSVIPADSQLQILSLSIMLHCLMSVCRIIIKIMDYGRTSLLRHLNTRIYSSLVQYSTGTLWVMTLPRVHPWTCSRTFYRDLLSAYLPIEFADYQAETQATQTIQAMQKFLASWVGYGQEYELVPISTMNLCTNEPSDKWTLGRIGLDSMVLYMYCLDSNAHPVSNPSVFWALACSMFIVFAARCYESAAYAVMRCLSVTFVSCVKTNKDIFRMFSPSGSHTILVFRIKCHGSIPTGTP